jgi:hypothetical protein
MTNLSQGRVRVLQQHLKVSLEPSTSLRSGLECRLLATEAVVTRSRLIRSTIGLDISISTSLVIE